MREVTIEKIEFVSGGSNAGAAIWGYLEGQYGGLTSGSAGGFSGSEA